MRYEERKYDKEKSLAQNTQSKCSDNEYIDFVTTGDRNDIFHFIEKYMSKKMFSAAAQECQQHRNKAQSLLNKVNKNLSQSQSAKEIYEAELNAVEGIGAEYGSAAVLRRKDNGKIKYGKGTSRFKRVIYRWRYRQEREAAAGYFSMDKKEKKEKVTVSDVLAEIQSKVKSGTAMYEREKWKYDKLNSLRYKMEERLKFVRMEEEIEDKKKREAKALRVSPVILTREQKEAVQRFYSTNAGAAFINTRLRNAYPDSTLQLEEKYSTVDAAMVAGSNESAGEGRVTLPSQTKQAVREAFLKGSVRDVMLAALYDAGKPHTDGDYEGDAYRGTRVPADLLAQFKVGDVMINTFVTSFSVDMFKSAKREGETDKKWNDGLAKAIRFTTGDYKTHTGVPVIYKKPRRAEYNTVLIHGTYEIETVIPPGTKFEIGAIEKKGAYTLITLRTVDTSKNAVRLMHH